MSDSRNINYQSRFFILWNVNLLKSSRREFHFESDKTVNVGSYMTGIRCSSCQISGQIKTYPNYVYTRNSHRCLFTRNRIHLGCLECVTLLGFCVVYRLAQKSHFLTASHVLCEIFFTAFIMCGCWPSFITHKETLRTITLGRGERTVVFSQRSSRRRRVHDRRQPMDDRCIRLDYFNYEKISVSFTAKWDHRTADNSSGNLFY